MKRAIALAGLALLVASSAALGQAQRGNITIAVTSADDGSVLPGATVEAQSDQTLTTRVGTTGVDGDAQLTALDPAANYVVTVTLQGFAPTRFEDVQVRAGQSTPLQVEMQLEEFTEELIITGESPVVDTTTATTGEEITLQLTEALPTARTYQDYLQLVPGVQATTTGNPASRSGLNYSDIGGTISQSRDNFYYFEGINVTDGLTGTFGANLNTEIIQEQSVLTGGLPAEFIGASGLVSNVITKSGGNQFSGSLNYYFQDDGLVADNEHQEDATFSRFDSAFTLGGPIVQDRAWFYTSYRILNREDDVVSLEGEPLRTVERDDDQAFGKVTWAITDRDLVTGLFLSDPTEFSGSDDPQIANQRDRSRDQGGDRWNAGYSRVWSNFGLELNASDHEGDLDQIPVNPDSRNNIIFRPNDPRSLQDEQLGGNGIISEATRSTESQRGSLEWLGSSSWGDHSLKIGAELSENGHFVNNLVAGDATYVSLDTRYLGQNVTAFEIQDVPFRLVDFNPLNTSDFNGFVESVNGHPQRAQIMASLDADGNGTLTPTEVAEGLVFNSTAGNPNGMINYDRTAQVENGSQDFSSEGTTYFLQDTWQWNRWAINAGVRAEEWKHIASDGSTEIFTFDTEYAPRVSIAYDLKGDGRQRLSAYYGRYYDPIRNNMTDFAGQISGEVNHEQVWVDAIDDWVTYRVRGGAQDPDAFFAPTTETPYTDEYQLGYKIDLGRSMSLETNLIKRETRDILEDYDLGLYSIPEGYINQFTGERLDPNHPESLFIPLSYFGYSELPESNFVIGTLLGGERDWEGAEVIFRKRFSNNWQMLASYNYADATGSSNSDSNADFQGDVTWLDPRAPNQDGTQPGLVEHLFKVAGSYQWNNGIQVGASYRWNSGVIVSRTSSQSGRNLPLLDTQDPLLNCDPTEGILDDCISFAGQTGNWLSPFAVGQFENEDYGILDLKLSYLWDLTSRLDLDFFLDVFNVLDEQATIKAQDLIAGGGGAAFGEGIDFEDPQRFFLGARLRF